MRSDLTTADTTADTSSDEVGVATLPPPSSIEIVHHSWLPQEDENPFELWSASAQFYLEWNDAAGRQTIAIEERDGCSLQSLAPLPCTSCLVETVCAADGSCVPSGRLSAGRVKVEVGASSATITFLDDGVGFFPTPTEPVDGQPIHIAATGSEVWPAFTIDTFHPTLVSEVHVTGLALFQDPPLSVEFVPAAGRGRFTFLSSDGPDTASSVTLVTCDLGTKGRWSLPDWVRARLTERDYCGQSVAYAVLEWDASNGFTPAAGHPVAVSYRRTFQLSDWASSPPANCNR